MSADLPKPQEWIERILTIGSRSAQEELMMQAFRIQFEHNPLYKRFCALLGRTPSTVQHAGAIPYLPIAFFKSEKVVTGPYQSTSFFQSSGTTGTVTSKHYYHTTEIYEASFMRGFRTLYGDPENLCILALLPSYLEQENSSLVFMVKKLMEKSGHPLAGFFMNDRQELKDRLMQLEQQKQRTLLIGVSYALLDLAREFPMPLQSTFIMETGGMKGRKKEMVRSELHQHLKDAFKVNAIHSEYGMTELFSQAYAVKDGLFRSPLWMKMILKDEDDPLADEGRSGVLHVADLANIYSCCFVATEDQGRLHNDGEIEILGRLDHSDIRGCSLMYNGS